MALLEKQLIVKRSTVPNSGNGLFTKKMIPKGTLIVEYKGRISTWKEVEHEENGYIFFVNRNHVIDARPYKKALAKFANDAKGLERIAGVNNNSKYVEDGVKVYIKSTHDIPAGAEIFVGYGKDYWNTIRHNIQLDKEKKDNKK